MKINFNKRVLINVLNAMTLSAILTQNVCAIGYFGYKEYENYAIEHTEEKSIDDIKNMIFNSKELTDEEKEFLSNTDFLTDVLETVNKSKYMLYDYNKRFNNIDIISDFDEKDLESYFDTEYIGGYYIASKKNKLYVKEYNTLNRQNSRTVAHEYVHLCQYQRLKYNFIVEAATEIITSEYFAAFPLVHSYKEETEILKILMEIIGPEPIWNYVFLGDFNLIEAGVKTYLSDSEYQEFLSNIKYDQTDSETKVKKLETLNKLLEIMYKNKYQSSIEDDEVIGYIKMEDDNSLLKRYYFNYRYINEEHSYCLNTDKKAFTLEEAVEMGSIMIINDEKEITYEEYTNLGKDNNAVIIPIGSFIGIENNQFYFELDYKKYLPTIYERENGKKYTK